MGRALYKRYSAPKHLEHFTAPESSSLFHQPFGPKFGP